MSSDRIHYLLQQLLHHQCTPDEKEELALWIDTLPGGEAWKTQLAAVWKDYQPDSHMNAASADHILQEIIKQDRSVPVPAGRPVRMFFNKWRIAATVALFGCISVVAYMHGRPQKGETAATGSVSGKPGDIVPGGNKAVLTLWNGAKVYLNQVPVGARVAPVMPQAVKVAGGLLSFAQAPAAKTPAGGMNTVFTPRGGQYQVILPDGSKVWLNAESSITFPSAFGAASRKVSVSGEAYFEIAADAAKPFTVSILSPEGRRLGTVRVLGTHFNINAYADESTIKTTLLEGAVSVSGTADTRVLAAGQQAQFSESGPVRLIPDADLREAVAWKDGLFDFEGSDIQNVMRRIARWYDVQVIYRNTTSAHFMGTISRNVNLSEVLKMLEMTGEVHFEVTGKTVTVLP